MSICIEHELSLFAPFVVNSAFSIVIVVVIIVVVILVVVSVVIVAFVVAVFIFVPVIIVLTGTSFILLSIFSSSIDYNSSAL